MVFLLLHIAIMAPPYVQGGSVGPNVYDKLNVASMGTGTTLYNGYLYIFWRLIIMDVRIIRAEQEFRTNNGPAVLARMVVIREIYK